MGQKWAQESVMTVVQCLSEGSLRPPCGLKEVKELELGGEKWLVLILKVCLLLQETNPSSNGHPGREIWRKTSDFQCSIKVSYFWYFHGNPASRP